MKNITQNNAPLMAVMAEVCDVGMDVVVDWYAEYIKDLGPFGEYISKNAAHFQIQKRDGSLLVVPEKCAPDGLADSVEHLNFYMDELRKSSTLEGAHLAAKRFMDAIMQLIQRPISDLFKISIDNAFIMGMPEKERKAIIEWIKTKPFTKQPIATTAMRSNMEKIQYLLLKALKTDREIVVSELSPVEEKQKKEVREKYIDRILDLQRQYNEEYLRHDKQGSVPSDHTIMRWGQIEEEIKFLKEQIKALGGDAAPRESDEIIEPQPNPIRWRGGPSDLVELFSVLRQRGYIGASASQDEYEIRKLIALHFVDHGGKPFDVKNLKTLLGQRKMAGNDRFSCIPDPAPAKNKRGNNR